MDGLSVDAHEDEIGSIQLGSSEDRCLSLLDSLDEMLQLLHDATVKTCSKPEVLSTLCSVYDGAHYIVGGLRKVCMQQHRNSEDVMSLLQLLTEREPYERAVPTAEETAIHGRYHPVLTLEHQQEETMMDLHTQPQPDEQMLQAQQPELFTSTIKREDSALPARLAGVSSAAESDAASPLREENRSLQLQLLRVRIELQNERDMRRTAEQHLQIMKQKDVLRRIQVQHEADKVRIKEDNIRILEMMVRDLRHRSQAS